jgi:hypothetical protein
MRDFCFQRCRALCEAGFVQMLHFAKGLHQRLPINHR